MLFRDNYEEGIKMEFYDDDEDSIYEDDDLMPVTDVWRELHPYEFNVFDRDDPWGEEYRDRSS